MNKCLKWAIFYADKLSWSIIPINPASKKPLVKSWKQYQTTPATATEIAEWFDKWPEANIGLVTGAVSNLTVLDIDEYEHKGTLEYIKSVYLDRFDDPYPPWTHTVTARTPSGGYHWFFQHTPDMVSRRVIPAVDCKTTGGYVVISPSAINGKRYLWTRAPFTKEKIVVPSIFPPIYESLFSVKKNSISTDEGKTQPLRVVDLDKGSRDESLFHIANSLTKGGMDQSNIRTVMHILGMACVPPFGEADIDAKILSALGRQEDRMGSLAEEIREWVLAAQGVWTYEQLDRELKIISKQERSNRRVIVHRLCEEGIIEPAGSRAGAYRLIRSKAEEIDFINVVESERYDGFKLALGEEELFKLMPKNIVIISGSPDAGKTAYLMNLVRLNQADYDIHYFSSEMGALEFKSRLSQFPNIALDEWTFTAKERGDDFHDVIEPNGVNIIDFLEMHDNFYEVGKHIKRIFDRLENGVAFIALQKNPGNENPLGGNRAREKARLVVNLDQAWKDGRPDGHWAKITKAKNWRTYDNPRGMTRHFRIFDGCQISLSSDWDWEESIK
jgi:hypothetical protein